MTEVMETKNDGAALVCIGKIVPENLDALTLEEARTALQQIGAEVEGTPAAQREARFLEMFNDLPVVLEGHWDHLPAEKQEEVLAQGEAFLAFVRAAGG